VSNFVAVADERLADHHFVDFGHMGGSSRMKRYELQLSPVRCRDFAELLGR
jgi:hypothetical protein